MKWSLKGEFFYLCTRSLNWFFRNCMEISLENLILGLNGLFAMELEKLLVNDNIGTSCQKDVSQALYQTLQRTNWALKTVRLASFQKPQLEFVSIFFKLVHLFVFFVLPLFVFALLFVLSFDVLSCYFYVSLSLLWWRFLLVEFWKKNSVTLFVPLSPRLSLGSSYWIHSRLLLPL